jgi:hypothetical protein
MTRAESINVPQTRDLRIWQRGREFVAAACGGFDVGAGPQHALERRAFWRQRSQRRGAAARRPAASQAAQSLRLLLRGLAARQKGEEVGPLSASAPSLAASSGNVAVGGRSRKTANRKVRQPIAAAAGIRPNKSFRDHRFQQQGLRLLEKALRAKKQLP